MAATLAGFLIDAVRGSELTATFSVFYFLGCVAAVLAVRNRGLFTAMVVPPLLLVIAVPLAYQQFSPGGGGLKDLAFNVAIPLVNRFPLMFFTTLVVVAIAAGRMYIRRQAAGVLARPARPRVSRRAETVTPGRAAQATTDRATTTADQAEAQRPPERPRTPDQSNRRAGEPATSARPAHSGNFPTGRYPTRSRYSGPPEEQTETFDRPQQFTRAHPDPRPRADRAQQHEPQQYEPRQYESRPRESRPHEQPQPQPHGRRQHDRYDDQAQPRGWPDQANPEATRAQRRSGSRHEASDVPLHPIPQVRYRDRDDHDPTHHR